MSLQRTPPEHKRNRENRHFKMFKNGEAPQICQFSFLTNSICPFYREEAEAQRGQILSTDRWGIEPGEEGLYVKVKAEPGAGLLTTASGLWFHWDRECF